MRAILILLIITTGCSHSVKSPYTPFLESDGYHGMKLRYICPDGRFYIAEINCGDPEYKKMYKSSKGYVDMTITDVEWEAELDAKREELEADLEYLVEQYGPDILYHGDL